MSKLDKLCSDANAVLKITAFAGEKFIVASDAMVSMTDTFDLKIKSGGFKKAFGRMFSGQSIFLQEFRAKTDGEMILSSHFLGDIMFKEMDGTKKYMLGENTFLASEGEIELSTKNKGVNGLISGEGIFQVEAEGRGTLCLASYGAILYKKLEVGERFVVDTNHIILRDSDMKYSVEMISTGIASLTGGEGYVMKFTGPGEVWYQTKNPSYLGQPRT